MFREDFTNIKSIILEDTFYCMDVLDYFCHKLRRYNNYGLFGLYRDLDTKVFHYRFMDTYKIPLGAVVSIDENNNLYVDYENTHLEFNLTKIAEDIEKEKEEQRAALRRKQYEA